MAKKIKIYIYMYTSEAGRECTEAVNAEEEVRVEVWGERLGGRRGGRGENCPVLPPRLRSSLSPRAGLAGGRGSEGAHGEGRPAPLGARVGGQ